MAPKNKKGGGGSGGAPKVTVDKTFGMKNKKGAKAQQQIKVIPVYYTHLTLPTAPYV